MNTELTQARLKELLEYNPDTGFFVWKVKRSHVSIGDTAGYVKIYSERKAYVNIRIDSVDYRAHRLAFLYMTGFIPDEIDHINRVGTDNMWSNLRKTCRLSNIRNRGRRKDNKSEVTGVRCSSAIWKADIVVNRKSRMLYCGDSKHDAIMARYKAEVELGWHESNSDTDAKRYVESLERK